MQKLITALVVLFLFTGCTANSNDITFPDEETELNFQGVEPKPSNYPQQQVQGAFDQRGQSNIPPVPPQLPQQPAATPQTEPNIDKVLENENMSLQDYYATISTSKGVITLKLYSNKAPQTVQNFVKKAQEGFYNGLKFHRVENWVIQGGDPTGTGTGGGQIPTEITDEPFKIGSLGVARGGVKEISNDSQFFICTDTCDWLTNEYTNFGEVVDGMEVAKTIEKNDVMQTVTIESHEPKLRPIR